MKKWRRNAAPNCRTGHSQNLWRCRQFFTSFIDHFFTTTRAVSIWIVSIVSGQCIPQTTWVVDFEKYARPSSNIWPTNHVLLISICWHPLQLVGHPENLHLAWWEFIAVMRGWRIACVATHDISKSAHVQTAGNGFATNFTAANHVGVLFPPDFWNMIWTHLG